MWGNRLGWGISFVIAAVVVTSLTFLARGASTISKPTAFGLEAADDTLAIPVSPQTVLGPPKPCDAARPYSEAIALYRREPNLYDDVAGNRSDLIDLGKLPAIQRLIEGAHCQHMSLFAADPERVVRYGEPPDLAALQAVGASAVQVGLRFQLAKRNAEAIRCFEAAFALGAKLFDERMTYQEMTVGLRLLGDAGVALSNLLFKTGETGRSETIQKFEAARQATAKSAVAPIASKLISIDRNVVGRHVGDVFYLAEHAAERTWRVEAILALGRMQYFVGEGGRRGDQRGATRQLKQYVTDPDPIIQAAAKAALELTREQMRTLG